MVVDPGWRGLQLSAGFSGRLGKLVFIPNRHHRSMGRIEDVPWIIDDTARSPTVSHLGPRIMVGVVGVLRRRIHLCRSICPMPSPGLDRTDRRIGGGVPDFFLHEAAPPRSAERSLRPRIMVGVVGVLRRRIHLCRSICPMPSPGLAWTHRRIGGGVPDFFLLEAQKPAPSTPWSKNVLPQFFTTAIFL